MRDIKEIMHAPSMEALETRWAAFKTAHGVMYPALIDYLDSNWMCDNFRGLFSLAGRAHLAFFQVNTSNAAELFFNMLKNHVGSGRSLADPVDVLKRIFGCPSDANSIAESYVMSLYRKWRLRFERCRAVPRLHFDVYRSRVEDVLARGGAQLEDPVQGVVALQSAAGAVVKVNLLRGTSTCGCPRGICKHIAAARCVFVEAGGAPFWPDAEEQSCLGARVQRVVPASPFSLLAAAAAGVARVVLAGRTIEASVASGDSVTVIAAAVACILLVLIATGAIR